MAAVFTPLRDLASCDRTRRSVAECVTADLIATYTPAKPMRHRGRWVYFAFGFACGATATLVGLTLLLGMHQ